MWRVCSGEGDLSSTQKYQFRVVIRAPLKLLEAFRRREPSIRRFLHHDQCLRLEPAALARRGERLLGEAFAVGRIEEHQRERLDRMRGAEPGRVAAKDAADAAEAER